MLFLALLLLLVLCYCAGLFFLLGQWKRIVPPQQAQVASTGTCVLSIIVVVRNEENNLPYLFKALQQQSFLPSMFELHLVNDASTDASLQLAHAFQKQASFSLQIHELTKFQGGSSPKKAAISQVFSQCRGRLIVVTDGDCQPESHWLRELYLLWQQKQAVFISGPVRYTEEQSLFEQLQAIDFAALIGVGASMMQAGKPGMCNAANMAFCKEAFLAVGGFTGNEHVPSGDDEFLLQKMAQMYPTRVHFLKSAAALVSTRACSNWSQFVQQRKRWAGKWRLHKGIAPKALAISVAGFYGLLVCSLVLAVLQPAYLAEVLLAWGLKTVSDFFFLREIFNFTKKPLPLKAFLLLELVYPFYVLFFAVAANWGSFTWKERSYRYSS